MLEVTKVAPSRLIKERRGRRIAASSRNWEVSQIQEKRIIHDSFRADNGLQRQNGIPVPVEGKYIKLPRIRVAEDALSRYATKGQVKSVVVSRRADRWFAAIAVDTTSCLMFAKPRNRGVDLGVTTLATLSTGENYRSRRTRLCSTECADCPARYLERRKILPIATRRNKTGKTSRTDKANIRTNALHKLTTGLVLDHTVIRSRGSECERHGPQQTPCPPCHGSVLWRVQEGS